jgi:hypothetical protein
MITFPKGFNFDPKTRMVSGIAGDIFSFEGVDMDLAPPSVLMVDSIASKSDVKNATERIDVKGRKGMRRSGPALKELGALRLLQRFGNAEAARDFAEQHKLLNMSKCSFYQDDSQWWRAKSNALRRIAKVMRSLL